MKDYEGYAWIKAKREEPIIIDGIKYVTEEHHIKETEFLISEVRKLASAKSRVWYSNALEVLGPLRWHLNELVQAMESWNRAAKRMELPMLPERKITDAKENMKKANDFFSGQ